MRRNVSIRLFFLAIFFWVFNHATHSAYSRIDEEIHFDPGKAVLRMQSKELLEHVIYLLVHNSELKQLEIIGHADAVEGKSNAMKLSLRRAQAVKDYFIQKGVDPDRLEVKGYGDTRPIATNQTSEGRAHNRRVEFNVAEWKSNLPDSPKLEICPTSDKSKGHSAEKILKSERIQLPGIDGVIFKGRGARGADCLGSAGYWTPSVKNVQAAEPEILKCVQKYSNPKAESPLGGKRQYTGVWLGKRKLIWIDIFRYPESSCPEWENKPCERTCVYNTDSLSLLYDPVDGACYNFCHSATVE